MQIGAARLARQRVEMQRHRHQHALPVVADRRHEDRPPREFRVELRLRQMLVLEAEAVELEGRRGAVFETRDHRLAAAGIAAHRVDGDGIVGRQQAGIDQRPQQRDRAGRIAAGIGDLLARSDLVGLVRRQFRKAIGPVGRDAKRGRGIQHLRREAPMLSISATVSFAASSGRQRMTRSTSSISALLAAASLRLSSAMLFTATSFCSCRAAR